MLLIQKQGVMSGLRGLFIWSITAFQHAKLFSMISKISETAIKI